MARSERFSSINSKNLRILVVEDHADSRDALSMFLTSGGHQVWVAADAEHASYVLDHTSVNVLLADVVLPQKSAWELLHDLKVNQRLPPFVVTMSAMHEWEVLGLSRAAGCHAHLAKPFNTDKLIRVLERACATVH